MDFLRVAGPSRLGMRYRLAEYHEKSGGPWSYEPSHASLPLLPDPEVSLEALQIRFASRLKFAASKSSNSAVLKFLLAEPACRRGTVTLLPRKGYRIRRSIRLVVPHMLVRDVGETYSVEWLQPRIDQLSDSEFAFSGRLFLEMFEAPEIRRREFCAWDTGRKNKWNPRQLRRLSSRVIAPMELQEFQDRLTACLKAKRELAEGGQVPLWRPKDDDAFL